MGFYRLDLEIKITGGTNINYRRKPFEANTDEEAKAKARELRKEELKGAFLGSGKILVGFLFRRFSTQWKLIDTF